MDNLTGIRTEPLPTRQAVAPAPAEPAGAVDNAAPQDVVSLSASDGSASPVAAGAAMAPGSRSAADELVARREVVAQKEARVLELQRLVAARRQELEPGPAIHPYLASFSDPVLQNAATLPGSRDAQSITGILDRDDQGKTGILDHDGSGAGLPARESDRSSQERREQALTASEQRLRAEGEALDERISAEASKAVGQRRSTLEAGLATREAELRESWKLADLKIRADAKASLDDLGHRYTTHLQTLETQYQEAARANAGKADELSTEVIRLQRRLVELEGAHKVARAEEVQVEERARQAGIGGTQGERERLVAQRDALRKELEAQQGKLSEARSLASKLAHEKVDLDAQLLRKQFGRVGSTPGQPLPAPSPFASGLGVPPMGDTSGWSTWSTAPVDNGSLNPPVDAPVDDGGWGAWRGEQ